MSRVKKKTCLWSLRPCKTQTSLLSFRDWLESWNFEFSKFRNNCLGIILSRQWTTKAMIRLRGCACWFAPLLFAYDIRQVFSWWGSNDFHTIVHFENSFCQGKFFSKHYTISEFRYHGNIDICFICKQYAEFNTRITEVSVNMHINIGYQYCHKTWIHL